MSCIYRIFFDNLSECYIGQTSNLKNRIKSHEYACNDKIKKNWKLYSFINTIGWKKVNFEILEDLDDDSTNLKKKERELFFIKLIKPSLNTNQPLRTAKQYYKEFKDIINFKRNIANLAKREEYNKKSLQYYYDNKDRLNKQRKEYKKNNLDKIKNQRQSKYTCSCGKEISIGSKSSHINTIYHNLNMIKNLKLSKSKLIYSNKNIDIRI